jgi:hypothetical protein
MLHIYEFDSSVIPAHAEDWYEVYGEGDVINPLFISTTLDNVIDYCYNSGKEFVVHTLAAYYNENGTE